MPINNDFESLLDALTDEGSKENDELMAMAERKFQSAYNELEPFFNRVGVLSRDFRKWYRVYLLGGGRPVPKCDAMLTKTAAFKHIDADMLPEVRAAQSITAPAAEPKPVQVETPYGSEVVPAPTTRPAPPAPKPGIIASAKPYRLSMSELRMVRDEDVVKFYNRVLAEFGEAPSFPMIGEYFGGTGSWAAGRLLKAKEAGLIKQVRIKGSRTTARFEQRVAQRFGPHYTANSL